MKLEDEKMSYIIGYLAVPFLIAFCIVHFILKKKYKRKNNKEMEVTGIIGRTVLIGLLFLVIMSFGRLS